ncbi:alpha/beta hydrolase [Myroides sp. NP-2]|nr:alpha/beta hydrolase [Myroides sp. NP-2]MBB1149536.1 alpha/beta hydrolase [Myroides sp. NP-2]
MLKGSLVAIASDLTLVKLEGCGHFILAEKAEEVAKEIALFL